MGDFGRDSGVLAQALHQYKLARGLTRWLEAGGGEGEGEGDVQGAEPDGAGKDARSMSGERTKFNGSGVVALQSAEDVLM